jgi:hypothetical protein
LSEIYSLRAASKKGALKWPAQNARPPASRRHLVDLKQIDGYGRIRQSTGYGKDEYEKAEHFLIKRLNEIRDAQRFGIRPERVFGSGGEVLMEHRHLSTIGDIAITFKQVDPDWAFAAEEHPRRHPCTVGRRLENA